MSAAVFGDYARYYDLFYRDKDYAAEACFVDGLLRAGGMPPGTLVDVGCGTGAHAREFARLGWRVHGVDRSPDMIALARQRTPAGAGVAFTTGDAATFDLGCRFAAAVSLFHVASYHAGPEELLRMLINVRRHLGPDGRFVFDFWHGPGVLADPPVRRERRFEDGTVRILRISEPVHDADQRVIEVRYDVLIEPVAGDGARRITELHRMRYFFLPELETLLRQAGFAVERTHAGLTGAELDDRAWYGLIVARAV